MVEMSIEDLKAFIKQELEKNLQMPQDSNEPYKISVGGMNLGVVFHPGRDLPLEVTDLALQDTQNSTIVDNDTQNGQ